MFARFRRRMHGRYGNECTRRAHVFTPVNDVRVDIDCVHYLNNYSEDLVALQLLARGSTQGKKSDDWSQPARLFKEHSWHSTMLKRKSFRVHVLLFYHIKT